MLTEKTKRTLRRHYTDELCKAANELVDAATFFGYESLTVSYWRKRIKQCKQEIKKLEA